MRRFSVSGWLLLTFAVLSASAGVVAIGLAVVVRSAFAELQYARIFPLGRPSLNGQRGLSKGTVRIGFYGDSRVSMWDTRTIANNFGSVENFGQGAITSGQLLLQLRTEPVVHSDWAIVQIGINDLHPLGALPRHQQEIRANLRGDLIEILRLLLDRSAHVVLTTIFPAGPMPLHRRILWGPETNNAIADTNNLIRNLARGAPRVSLLDASVLLAGQATVLPDAYVDPDFFLHLNDAAYTVLNRHLAQILMAGTATQ